MSTFILQGTTPTHSFALPCEADAVKAIRITYSQNDNVLVTKTTADCTVENERIYTTLTQEDTFLFDESQRVTMNVRVLTTGGSALRTHPQSLAVIGSPDKEVLT